MHSKAKYVSYGGAALTAAISAVLAAHCAVPDQVCGMAKYSCPDPEPRPADAAENNHYPRPPTLYGVQSAAVLSTAIYAAPTGMTFTPTV